MANGHGGARKGAGRKPKPLAEKLATGNRGHRPLKKLTFGGNGGGNDGRGGYSGGSDGRGGYGGTNGCDFRPTAPDYLRVTVKPQNDFPSAVDFFEETVDFLVTTNCLHMIPTGNIASFALAKFFLVEAAYSLAKTAVVSKNGKDSYAVTGFAKGFFECAKTEMEMWDRIWQVVRDNSETLVKNPEEDFIAQISMQRMRKKPTAAAKEWE